MSSIIQNALRRLHRQRLFYGVRFDEIDWQAENLFHQLRHRGYRRGGDTRIRNRSARVEIRGDDALSAARDILSDQRNSTEYPVHGAEWDHSNLHVEGRLTEVKISIRDNIYHRSIENQIIGIEDPISSFEVRGHSAELDSRNSRIGNLGGNPTPQINEREQPREQGEFVEVAVAKFDYRGPGHGGKEIRVGIGPDIAGQIQVSGNR